MSCVKSNIASETVTVWVESEYLNLESEDKNDIRRNQLFQTMNFCQIQIYPQVLF